VLGVSVSFKFSANSKSDNRGIVACEKVTERERERERERKRE